jgi:hypothetical protein
MNLGGASLKHVLRTYRGLCNIKDPAHEALARGSSLCNRLGALSLIRDILPRHQRLTQFMYLARDTGEFSSAEVMRAFGLGRADVDTLLANYWDQEVEVQGLAPERIFFERRYIRAWRKSHYRYRLSPLGHEIIKGEP